MKQQYKKNTNNRSHMFQWVSLVGSVGSLLTNQKYNNEMEKIAASGRSDYEVVKTTADCCYWKQNAFMINGELNRRYVFISSKNNNIDLRRITYGLVWYTYLVFFKIGSISWSHGKQCFVYRNWSWYKVSLFESEVIMGNWNERNALYSINWSLNLFNFLTDGWGILRFSWYYTLLKWNCLWFGFLLLE